jgi:two-component system nitrogen regulation response regulator GlnG
MRTSRKGATVLVAESQSMKNVLSAIEELSENPAPVLIEGEPGSGRELIARLLHRHSSRNGVDMVSVKAGAAPSEVFSSPVDDEPETLFEKAQGGTLLVRDVCELRRRSQRTLNAALANPSKWNMRVLATSDPGLLAAVEADVFYGPLLEHLCANKIVVPPLRERGEDIVPLMAHLVRDLGRDMGRKHILVSTLANDTLMRYPWPGNVAEMKQVARRLVVRAKGGRIEASDVAAVLPTLARRVPMEEVSFEDLVRFKLSELLRRVEGYPLTSLHEEVMGLVERPLLRIVLEHTGNNQLKAAEILGLSRNTLRRRLESFGCHQKRPKLLRARPKAKSKKTRQA